MLGNALRLSCYVCFEIDEKLEKKILPAGWEYDRLLQIWTGMCPNIKYYFGENSSVQIVTVSLSVLEKLLFLCSWTSWQIFCGPHAYP